MGTGFAERARGVSADGLGNVYVTGETYGSLDGDNAGSADAFLSKFSSAGVLLWTEQLGTSSEDQGCDVSADALGNVFITGRTLGVLDEPGAGGYDAFLSMYGSEGDLAWTRQLGTIAEDAGYGVSADGLGNVYITGDTRGSLGAENQGRWDVFVAKYDSLGNILWTTQFGTDKYDTGADVTVDGLGNVFVTGTTYGSLIGDNAGFTDAFVTKLTPEPGTIILLGFGGVGLLRRRRA